MTKHNSRTRHAAQVPPQTHSAPRPGVTEAQQREAVAVIRRIGALPPLPPTKYACERCEVGWAGPEKDCWSCALPATARSRRAASALHLLLGAVAGPDTKAAV